MRIYLAGRCDTNWRDEIVGVPLDSQNISPWDLTDRPWPILARAINGRHDYMGAYPVDRCKDYHGLDAQVFSHYPYHDPDGSIPTGKFTRAALAAIDQSDIVFAWIDREGLYGTAAEIAYAHAKGKIIWLGIGSHSSDYGTQSFYKDYWFVSQLAPNISHDDHDDCDAYDANPASIDLLSAKSAFDGFMEEYELRTMPYVDYLKTDYWQRTRQAALIRCDHKCMVCGSKTSLEVHHNTYERRGQELPTDLIVLCRACHQTFHDAGRLAR